jgi:DoxX-like family
MGVRATSVGREFLAAVGLIVPAALGIAPVLVPLAATGAVLLFAGAVIMRLRRGERATIIADLVYLAMAAFVCRLSRRVSGYR